MRRCSIDKRRKPESIGNPLLGPTMATEVGAKAITPEPSRRVLSPPQASNPPTHGRTSERAAAVLRDAILDGVIAPGSWLREVEIAKELNVSRTPIRDAFRLLAAEGLLILHVNQGAVVPKLSDEDIRSMYVVREVLEGLSARLAAQFCTDEYREKFAELLSKMHEAADSGSLDALARLNFEFHATIIQACGNPYLERSLLQVQQAIHRRAGTTLRIPGRVEESIDSHERLAQFIIDGDADKADELAREEIRRIASVSIGRLSLTDNHPPQTGSQR